MYKTHSCIKRTPNFLLKQINVVTRTGPEPEYRRTRASGPVTGRSEFEVEKAETGGKKPVMQKTEF